MLGERIARGKSIHSVKQAFHLHEMDSLPLRGVPPLPPSPRLRRTQCINPNPAELQRRRAAENDKGLVRTGRFAGSNSDCTAGLTALFADPGVFGHHRTPL